MLPQTCETAVELRSGGVIGQTLAGHESGGLCGRIFADIRRKRVLEEPYARHLRGRRRVLVAGHREVILTEAGQTPS